MPPLKRLRPRLHSDWRARLLRLWRHPSVLVWGALCGIYAAWPAFQDHIKAPIFAAASAAMGAVIAAGKLLKRPGADT